MGNNTQIENALAAARHVLALRYEGAACAFAAGSIIRGEGTASSDIDLVVVFDRVDRAWRESFVDHGFPVEAFVHDPETLAWFINNDAKSGHPLMLDMIASGTLMGTDVVRADTLQAAARSQLAAGPRPFAGEHCDSIRYQITDLLDDLRGERSPAEIRAIAAQLYQPLADLVLLGRGTWSGKGKWIPKLLGKLDQELAQGFDDAFRMAANGECAAIVGFVERELAPHGGPYFAGDKRMALAEMRHRPD
ncbi:nucleotidyltransferase domain-containing protein [Phyllobacterium sp. 628]|uniref:nucleotidyltransferase domain-containing protein n=1 Tax=Phyllobacterium sp. 628 TaxID=2718938 RepID=UPI0016622CEC|nr:nucleotidyltransferase domain-containing protein [Phyllobacterium sp. 628]QND52186.1 nucleotidyltransferase domain-containing protein [Phyllobacterium sp. 628]